MTTYDQPMSGTATARAFEAYGVACAIRADSEELRELAAYALPPLAREADPATATATFELRERDASIEVLAEGVLLGSSPDREVAAGILDAAVRARIASAAPERVFVHAGAVAHRGGAIVVPGRSFSGKTTLVAELLEHGAAYLSDEYAVLDDSGMVHPYPRPLGVRSVGSRDGDRIDPAELGLPVAQGPLPVATIVITSYRPGARWDPSPRTSGEGALALLANTVPARERPEESLRAVRAAATNAAVLESERGEAKAAARALLA
jgi:hypothetical protein